MNEKWLFIKRFDMYVTYTPNLYGNGNIEVWEGKCRLDAWRSRNFKTWEIKNSITKGNELSIENECEYSLNYFKW